MDLRIQNVIEQVEGFLTTVDDGLALPRESAEFLHALVLARRPKVAVEIGTSYGYSGLWIASALRGCGGRLITIDREQYKSDKASAHFNEAGLADRIEVVTSSALEALQKIQGPVDFVLNDADKGNCFAYVDALFGKLSDGAVILTDNTTSHEEELRPFVSQMRSDGRFFSTHVPIGSGMELSIKGAT